MYSNLNLDKNSQAVKKRCGPVQNGQFKKVMKSKLAAKKWP